MSAARLLARPRLLHYLRSGMLLFVLAVLVAVPARAHANLLEASPAVNGRLDGSPGAIRLTFSEPIEPAFSRIRLLDLSGAEIASGGVVDAAERSTLVLTLSEPLPDNIYTVSWRVVSAADGHGTQGSFAFGVGMAAGTRTVISLDESIRAGATLARWLDMLSAALTLGVIVFALTIWRPGIGQGLPARETRFRRLIWLGWTISAAGLLLGLFAQASEVSAGADVGALSEGIIQLITGSAYGWVWLARAAVWAAFGLLLAGAGDKAARWGLLFGLAAGFAVLPSLVSHARAVGSVDALLNDILHRVAAALWTGGLVAFIAALWPDVSLDAKPVGRAVRRFSNLARFYVLLLAAGGLFAATQYIPDGDALIETGYGRALTVKGVIFAAMFALAAFNLLVVERRLRRSGEEGWIGTLRITVGAETALGAALMLMSAVMATSVPADDMLELREQASQPAAVARGNPYFGMATEDDVMIHLEVVPALAGENEFIVTPYTLDDGQPIVDATRVRLRFSHLEQNLGESALEAASNGQGVYDAAGANLSVPGRWRVRVTLQRPGAFDTVADFDFAIPLP